MDKEVKKFKEDYKNIKSRVKLIKKKLLDLKKETYSIVRDADRLHERGNKTMYTHAESLDAQWKPKFNGLNDYIEMDNLNMLPMNDSETKEFVVLMETETEEEDEDGEDE